MWESKLLPARRCFGRLVLLLLSASSTALRAQTGGPPRIFYSDIVSGPGSGGEAGGGAFVTLNGSGFGKEQGNSSVTLAGSPITKIVSWSEHKVVVQLTASDKSGDFAVVVPADGQSNHLPFSILDGRICFVSPSGRDSAVGDFHAPWASIAHAVHAARPGDVIYVGQGADQLTADNYRAAVAVQQAGSAAKPIALVAYPGTQPLIGDPAGEEFGVRTPAIHGGPFSNWVLAGFTIRGANSALKLVGVDQWRIVNNDFSCPSGNGAAGCVEVAESSNIAFLGNTVHNAGSPGASKRYQSVYFTTDSNHIEVGWNRIENNHSCRGLQFHSSPLSANTGFNQYDLLIHDNEISGQVCDGLNLATIDPSKGRIAVFNNLIHHVGSGPEPPDGEANYACINSPGFVNHGAAGTGTVEIFNNTLVDCGAAGGPSAGTISVGSGSPQLLLRNNLIEQPSGLQYFTRASALNRISGSDNLFFGGGPAPGELKSSIDADPRLSPDTLFRPSGKSVAKRGGRDCGVTYDLAGAPRPVNGVCSVGAFQ